MKCTFVPSAESTGILLPWAGLCLGSRIPGRVNTSRIIPQWLGEVGGTKGGNSLPFSASKASLGRTVHRDC